MLVVLKLGWCSGESNEMLVLMLQGKQQNKTSFSWFLCTERQQTGLQNTQKKFQSGGFTPMDPPAGCCPCTPPKPRRPLDPSHSGSVLPKHFFQFPCLEREHVFLNLQSNLLDRIQRFFYPTAAHWKIVGHYMFLLSNSTKLKNNQSFNAEKDGMMTFSWHVRILIGKVQWIIPYPNSRDASDWSGPRLAYLSGCIWQLSSTWWNLPIRSSLGQWHLLTALYWWCHHINNWTTIFITKTQVNASLFHDK